MLIKANDVSAKEATNNNGGKGKQAALWIGWTLFVIGFAFLHWQLDLTAGRPDPIIGLIIHTVLAGLVGLIILTVVEMRVNPEGFLDRHDH